MELGAEERWLVRLAVVLFAVAAVATVWEAMAAQAPSSPYHFGVLPGPVRELRSTAGTLALAIGLLAWLWPTLAFVTRGPAVVALLTAGSALTVLALGYGATTGMYGIQFDDLRPASQWILGLRAVGYGLLGAGLVAIAVRVLRRGFGRPGSG